MFLYLLRGTDFSRMAMALFFLAVNVTVGGKRMVVRTALHRFRASGYNQKHIVIVGSGDIARDCVRRIRQSREFGYTLLGYVSDRKNWSALPYLGTFDQLDGYLSRTKPDEVIAGLGGGGTMSGCPWSFRPASTRGPSCPSFRFTPSICRPTPSSTA